MTSKIKYTTIRNGYYHYHRKVPKHLKGIVGYNIERLALKTKDPLTAAKKASHITSKLDNLWDKLTMEGGPLKNQDYENAVKIAKINGFTYLPALDLGESNLIEIIDRFKVLRQQEPEKIEKKIGALWGGHDIPVLKLSKCFEVYEECVKTNNARKSPEQYRKWKNTKLWGINRFIEIVGDIDFDSINRNRVLIFRQRLSEDILNGLLNRKSANKQIAQVRTILRTIDDHKNLNKNIGVLFANINFDVQQDPEESTKPYDNGFIKKHLMRWSNYKDLNKEAALSVFAMANTGMRITELCGLKPKDIHLDAPIPFVSIVQQDDRELKTKQSRREIPLVGASLWAFKQLPHGYFKHYYDKNSQLSSVVNKYLKNHGLRPREGNTLNSLRHNFEDNLTSLEPENKLKVSLMGHRLDRADYGQGPSLELKKKYIDQIAFQVIDRDISQEYIS